jgi:hypothetical protein
VFLLLLSLLVFLCKIRGGRLIAFLCAIIARLLRDYLKNAIIKT